MLDFASGKQDSEACDIVPYDDSVHGAYSFAEVLAQIEKNSSSDAVPRIFSHLCANLTRRFTTKEIAEELSVSYINVNRALKRIEAFLACGNFGFNLSFKSDSGCFKPSRRYFLSQAQCVHEDSDDFPCDDSPKSQAIERFLKINSALRARLLPILKAIYENDAHVADKNSLCFSSKLSLREIPARISETVNLLGADGEKDFSIVEKCRDETSRRLYELIFIDERILFSIYHDFGNEKFEKTQKVLRVLGNNQQVFLSIDEIVEKAGVDESARRNICHIMDKLFKMTSIPEYREKFGFHIEKRARLVDGRCSRGLGACQEYAIVLDQLKSFRTRQIQLMESPKIAERTKKNEDVKDFGETKARLESAVKVKLTENVPGNFQNLLRNSSFNFNRDAIGISRKIMECAKQGEASAIWPVKIAYDLSGSRHEILRNIVKDSIKYALELGFVVASVEFGYFSVFFLDEKERIEKLKEKYGEDACLYNKGTVPFSINKLSSKIDSIKRRQMIFNGHEKPFPEFMPDLDCAILTEIASKQSTDDKVSAKTIAKKLCVDFRFIERRIKLLQKNANKIGVLPRKKSDGQLELLMLESINGDCTPTQNVKSLKPNDDNGSALFDNRRKEDYNSRNCGHFSKKFMADIGKYPLLTHDQEIELGKKIAEGTPEEKEKAINTFILHNLAFVIYMAKKYIRYYKDVDMTDLFGYGVIGLGRAALKYDHTKGWRFLTYAGFWINQSFQRGTANQNNLIQIPPTTLQRIFRINKARFILSREFGRKPTDQEIADYVELSVKTVSELSVAQKSTVSLDAPIGNDEGNSNLHEVLPGQNAISVENIEEREKAAKLRKFLTGSGLTQRELFVIKACFGIRDDGGWGPEKTVDKVSKELGGISRQCVGKTRITAILKLREIPGIEEFLEF